MMLVMFRSGEGLYAVDARRVVEVVPRVDPRPVPHAPAFVLGLLAYRGRVVPVVDFGLLIGSARARSVLSSRVIVARFAGRGGAEQLVGLVADEVIRVRNADAGQVAIASVDLDAAPYLGAVLRVDEGLVQMVEVDKLLTDRVEGALFGAQAEPG
jgi:chemotaxis-related protein WspB